MLAVNNYRLNYKSENTRRHIVDCSPTNRGKYTSMHFEKDISSIYKKNILHKQSFRVVFGVSFRHNFFHRIWDGRWMSLSYIKRVNSCMTWALLWGWRQVHDKAPWRVEWEKKRFGNGISVCRAVGRPLRGNKAAGPPGSRQQSCYGHLEWSDLNAASYSTYGQRGGNYRETRGLLKELFVSVANRKWMLGRFDLVMLAGRWMNCRMNTQGTVPSINRPNLSGLTCEPFGSCKTCHVKKRTWWKSGKFGDINSLRGSWDEKMDETIFRIALVLPDWRARDLFQLVWISSCWTWLPWLPRCRQCRGPQASSWSGYRRWCRAPLGSPHWNPLRSCSLWCNHLFGPGSDPMRQWSWTQLRLELRG